MSPNSASILGNSKVLGPLSSSISELSKCGNTFFLGFVVIANNMIR
jgi:hypothetical protein